MSHWCAGLSTVKLASCGAVFWTDPRPGLASAVMLGSLQVSQIGTEVREFLLCVTQPFLLALWMMGITIRMPAFLPCWRFCSSCSTWKRMPQAFWAGFSGQQCGGDRWQEVFAGAGCSQASKLVCVLVSEGCSGA